MEIANVQSSAIRRIMIMIMGSGKVTGVAEI